MKKLILAFILSLLIGGSAYAVVSSTITQNIYATDGLTTIWYYTFPIVDITYGSDLQIWLVSSAGINTQITTNYSINTTLSQVIYPTVASGLPALVSGQQIILMRVEPLTQNVAASNQGPAPSPVVMGMSDKLTMLAQQIQSQAVLQSLPVITPLVFPTAISGDLIGWGNNGLVNIANPSAVAQWGINGANISYLAGNVGIGTNNPGASLDVNGTLRSFSGAVLGLSNGNVGIGTDATPDATLEITQVTGTAPLMVSSTATTNGDYFSVINGGNIGIGSTAPGTKFDVQGTIRSLGAVINGNAGIGTSNPSQKLQVNGAILIYNPNGIANQLQFLQGGTNGWTLATASSNNDLYFYNGATGADVLHFAGSNNVGIGSAVPGSALDVNGTTRVFGNIGINSTAPGMSLDIQGSVRSFTNKSSSGARTLCINSTGVIFSEPGSCPAGT